MPQLKLSAKVERKEKEKKIVDISAEPGPKI